MDLGLGSSMGAQRSIVSNRISSERPPRLLHRFNFPCGTIENPDFDERAGIDLPPWFAKKWILHALIAFVVGILIWVLYGAARKIEAVE